MDMEDIRKLAHEILYELDDESVLEGIQNMRSIKKKRNGVYSKEVFSAKIHLWMTWKRFGTVNLLLRKKFLERKILYELRYLK